MDHHDVKVFADVQGDAQDMFRRNTPSEIGESLTACPSQMGRTFLAHGKYLLCTKVPTDEARAGNWSCASPMVGNEIRPRRLVGRRYFISHIGGFGIGHLQIP